VVGYKKPKRCTTLAYHIESRAALFNKTGVRVMILKNMKVAWAKLREDNKDVSVDFGDTWSIQVYVDKDFAEKWNSSDMSPKAKVAKADVESGNMSIQFKKDCVWKKSGDPKQPPVVVDMFGEPVTTNIGNGSLCNIQYKKWDWTYMGKKGTSTELTAVQVVELVEFAGGGDDTVGFSYDAKAEVPLADVTMEEGEDDIPF
jgi:hypothetical protein